MKKVLVIDDEDHIREVAQLSLEMVAGWQVFTASSGQEGIIQAESIQPDLILLDMMMPEMDGKAAFENLQANVLTKHIPVIILTAKVQAADQRRFVELGVTGVISKPFDPMNLALEAAKIIHWDI